MIFTPFLLSPLLLLLYPFTLIKSISKKLNDFIKIMSYVILIVLPGTLFALAIELTLAPFVYVKLLVLVFSKSYKKAKHLYLIPLYLVFGILGILAIVIGDIINIVKSLSDFNDYLKKKMDARKMSKSKLLFLRQ
jgi:hypothetical protein